MANSSLYTERSAGDMRLIERATAALFPGARWFARHQQGGYRARVYRVDWQYNGQFGRFAARVGENGSEITREHRIGSEILPVIHAAAPRVLGLFSVEGSTLSAREWVDGIPLSMGEKADYGVLMDLLAAQHRDCARDVPDHWAELCFDYGARKLAAAFESLVRAVDAGLRDINHPEWLDRDFAALAGRLHANADDIASELDRDEKAWVHGDAVPGNIVHSSPTGSFTLIDWEQFGSFLPHLDVLSALYHHRDEDRGPLIERYVRSRERFGRGRADIGQFRRDMDLVDLQRSAEIVAFWYDKAMTGTMPIEMTGGFIARRAAALKAAARRLGVHGGGRTHSFGPFSDEFQSGRN